MLTPEFPKIKIDSSESGILDVYFDGVRIHHISDFEIESFKNLENFRIKKVTFQVYAEVEISEEAKESKYIKFKNIKE